MENRSCVSHTHKDSCQLKNEMKDLFNNCECNCNFDEFNIHLKSCEFINKLINNERFKQNLTYKICGDECIKICCCSYGKRLENILKDDNFDKKGCEDTIKKESNNDKKENKEDIPHSEFGKFSLLSKEIDNDIKTDIYKNNKKGKLKTNKNIIIQDSYTIKDFSLIGRKKEIIQIYDIIINKENPNNNINSYLWPERGKKRKFCRIFMCLFI
jgi:hypothetical protein